MPNLESVDHTVGYYLFKGEPGLRKSTQALSFPLPQYWFSYDQKMRALEIPAKKWGIKMSEVDYDDYTDWDKGKNKLEQLQVNCKYKTIVIDSVTSLADAILRQSLKFKGANEKGKQISGIAVSSIEEFNAEASALSEMIAITKDIHKFHKVNIILIAHVIQVDYKSLTNKETHISRSIVTAAKKVAAKIPAYCDEVYHFNLTSELEVGKGGKYGLLTVHTGDDFARTGLPLKPQIIFEDNPLYDNYILPAINQLKNTTSVTKI